MPQFITRVELHYASAEDYANLHKQMGSRGFTHRIKMSDGSTHQLPFAEYVLVTSEPWTPFQVCELAKSAADAIGKSSFILTTEGTCALLGSPKPNHGLGMLNNILGKM